MRKELDIYYDLAYIFDDNIEIVADAIKELTLTNKRRSVILTNLELLRLNTLVSELDQLYNININTLREFRDKKINHYKQLVIDFK